MVAEGMIQRGVSIRHMAKQFGVREGPLRYRPRRPAEGERPDGRSWQRSATYGYEEAIHGLLKRLGDVRLPGLFRRYGGVALWVGIDNLKTGVAPA